MDLASTGLIEVWIVVSSGNEAGETGVGIDGRVHGMHTIVHLGKVYGRDDRLMILVRLVIDWYLRDIVFSK